MTKISLHPPSGFRDFSPSETLVRQNLMDTIARVYRKYGFQPISVTSLENLEVLQGKGGGSDNEKLIFKILRRGDDLKNALAKNDPQALADMGLRFDLTLPLARYYASRRQELPRPFKVYHMAPVWRADRPQKGRFREFYQCDVDILGTSELGAEVECLSAILEVFEAIQLKGVRLVLNDRRLLTALGSKLGVALETWQLVLVVLDKLDKIGADGVKKEITEKNLLSANALAELDRILLGEADLNAWEALHPDAVGSLRTLMEIMDASFPEAEVRFLPTLVRGQDYYTGTIFELHHAELSGSLGGGGRYDRLLELFQGEAVPAFGGSIGFERLCLILGEGKQVSETPKAFFPLFSAELRPSVTQLARELRRRGISTDVYPDAAKLKNQFKYADDRKIPFTILVGDDEAARKIAKVKDMQSREEKEIPQSELADYLEKVCLR